MVNLFPFSVVHSTWMREFDEWAALLMKLHSFRPNNRDDVNLWMLENDGSFSVNSFSPKQIVKHAAFNRQNSNLIWKASCPKKVKVKLLIFSFERLNTVECKEFSEILPFLPIFVFFV